MPSAKRGALVEQFFQDPQCKVFLSTDAGGVGLNLQAASMVINMDLPWNPAVLGQRIARAHCHGQKQPVNVINLIAQGTIEERMLDTLAAKCAVFDAALDAGSDVVDLSFKDAGQGILQGGFPEEVMRPLRQALGWALSAHLALVKDKEPNEDLPAPRVVEAELVAAKRIGADLAARVDRVRALTAPPAEDEEESPPPSLEAAQGFIATIQEVIDLGRELIAKEGL